MTPPGDRRRGIARRVLDPVGTEGPSKRIREATAVSRPHRPRGSVSGGAQWRDVKWRSDDALRRSARKAGDNLAKGSVRHFGARSDPMRVLSGLASTAGERRPARLLRSSRSPRAEATAACGTKARVEKVRRFRYRTPLLSTIRGAPSRGAMGIRCSTHRMISRSHAYRIDSRPSDVHGQAAAGTTWSGK
jgi:hypothetical protein